MTTRERIRAVSVLLMLVVVASALPVCGLLRAQTLPDNATARRSVMEWHGGAVHGGADSEADWSRAEARILHAYDQNVRFHASSIENAVRRSVLRSIVSLIRHESFDPPPPDVIVISVIGKIEQFAQETRAQFSQDAVINLFEVAAAALAESVDSYSQFIPPFESALRRARQFGEAFDFGVRLARQDGELRVRHLAGAGLAARSGVLMDDILLAIGNVTLSDLDIEDAALLLDAVAGRAVSLRIRRGARVFDLPLLPEAANLPASSSRRLADVVYIRLYRFDTDAREMVEREIVFAGGINRAKSGGIVLDLRGNGGGLMQQGALIAGAFLNGGAVVSVESRDPLQSVTYSARPGDLANGLPIVLLTDEFTASAAEIVAAALQDHRRAMVVGRPTRGKGTVQSRFELGGAGAVYLTTGRFARPSGAWLQKTPVVPDLTLGDPGDGEPSISPHSCPDLPDIDDPWLNCAIAVLKAGSISSFLGTSPRRQ